MSQTGYESLLLDEEAMREVVEELARLEKRRDEVRARLGVWKPRCTRRATRVIGVDGSFAMYSDEHILVIVSKAVAVRLGQHEARVETLGPVIAVLPVGYTGRVARETAEELTSLLELLAARRLVERTEDVDALLVFDGPLIDPPYQPVYSRARDIARRLLGLEYSSYHSLRASILSELDKKLWGVAGFVKRASGTIISTMERLVRGNPRTEVSDSLLLQAILSIGEATKLLLPEEHIEQYKELHVRTAYWRTSPSRVARVDVTRSTPWREVIEELACWLSPSGLPLPVYLAHVKSNVSLKMARAAHRLIARRVAELLAERGLQLFLGGREGGEEATLS